MGANNGGRHMGGAVDLDAVKGLDKGTEDAARVAAEDQAGMRCRGCGERIVLGFEFVLFRAVNEGGLNKIQAVKTFACDGRGDRGNCQFATQQAQVATAMKPLDIAWLDQARHEPQESVEGSAVEMPPDGEDPEPAG